MTDDLQPAWVLHRRPYTDGGFLVEILTAETGRLSAVLRGARRKLRGGSTVGLAQPFIPLLIATRGRGDLKTLARIESVGTGVGLTGVAQFSGLYVNELLTRLLPRHDPAPMLFALYGETLAQLSSLSAETSLRRFELALLDELGYGLSITADAAGEPLDPNAHYSFDPARGLVMVPVSGVLSDAQGRRLIPGGVLGNIADCLNSDALLNGDSARVAKWLMREALAQYLGDKPLESRRLFKALTRPTVDERRAQGTARTGERVGD